MNKTMVLRKAGKKRGATRALRQLRRDTAAWVLILPFLFLIFYVLWKPTVQGMIWSFFEMKGYNVGEFAGLGNYRVVLKDTEFLGTLKNTLMYVIWSLVIGFWPPVVIAIMLNELTVGKSFFKFTAYMPSMIPGIAVSMLWYYIYYPNASGLLNMLLSMFGAEPGKWLQKANATIPLILVSNTWKGMGGAMLLYLAALQGVNRELYEAALIDGAGICRRAWKITLPQISGVILINLVRQIIGVFQIMEQPLAMTGGGPNNASMSLGLLGYRYAFQTFKVGNALALNVVMFFMLIVLTAFYFAVQNKVNEE